MPGVRRRSCGENEASRLAKGGRRKKESTTQVVTACHKGVEKVVVVVVERSTQCFASKVSIEPRFFLWLLSAPLSATVTNSTLPWQHMIDPLERPISSFSFAPTLARSSPRPKRLVQVPTTMLQCQKSLTLVFRGVAMVGDLSFVRAV